MTTILGHAQPLPMVIYITAYLAHTGFHHKQIRKAVAFEDSNGDYWIQLLFHIPMQYLPGAASTICHFFHGTTQAGLYGILTLLQEFLSMTELTIPLTKPIIMASPGNIKKDIISPYQGFFALHHDDEGSIPANAACRQAIIDKFRTHGKNYLDIAFHGQVSGPKSRVHNGGAWGAQIEVSNKNCLVGSLGLVLLGTSVGSVGKRSLVWAAAAIPAARTACSPTSRGRQT